MNKDVIFPPETRGRPRLYNFDLSINEVREYQRAQTANILYCAAKQKPNYKFTARKKDSSVFLKRIS